jgi:hypothetical protein
MSPRTYEARARLEARLCADCANAALKAAQKFDAVTCSQGIADMACAVAGDNELAKLMLLVALARIGTETGICAGFCDPTHAIQRHQNAPVIG